MTPLTKKILALFVLLLLPVGAIFFVLNSAWVSEKILPRVLNVYLTEGKVSYVLLENQSFGWSEGLELTGVEFRFVRNQDEIYFVNTSSLKINSLSHLFDRNKKFNVMITGLRIEGPQVVINNADLALDIQLKKNKLKQLNGSLDIFETDFHKYRLKFVRTDITGDQDSLSLNNFVAEFYSGNIKGNISLYYPQDVRYSVNIKFADVDLTELKSANDAVFSTIAGRMEGALNINGDAKQLNSLQASFNTPSGGKVKAFLLQTIIESIPGNTHQRKALDTLIKEGGFIPLEKANIQIRSLSSEKLVGLVAMESRKFNLNITLPLDINIDGGMGAVIENMEKFSPKRRRR